MKTRNLLLFGMVAFCMAIATHVIGQSPVNDITIKKESAKIEFAKEANYLLEIGGPSDYYWKRQINQVSDIVLPSVNAKGEKFEDGLYTLQVTPIFTLTDSQRTALNKMREKNDQAGIQAFREKHDLPSEVKNFAVNFSVKDGKFVSPDLKEAGLQIPTMSSQWEVNHPALYASIQTEAVNYSNYATDNSLNEEDQVFVDDVIVDGSLCVGQDCVNGENFGFDTQRIKENNLRIHFDDTSSSASFPGNDWRIVINDSNNGGASYFVIEDSTAGTQPFRVQAGAGNNALYVSNSGGNVGMGTSTPVVELHVTDGDSPTMRLEQNGSNGWTPQIWDIAGNETNFFVRDVTNSSKLPFKIRPGAPDNSLYVDPDGDIGLGTANPGDNALQVESGEVYFKNGGLTIETGDLKLNNGKLKMTGNVKVTGNSVIDGDAIYRSAGGTTRFTVDEATGFVGIGNITPAHLLELADDDAVKPGGGTWAATSDRRLKTNIKNFSSGLDAVLKIRPVTYNYNGKLGMPTDKEFVGVIAQEMQEVAPYTVSTLKKEAPKGESPYLQVDSAPITYMLINAVQEQQDIIDAQNNEIEALKSQLAEMKSLQNDVASLTKLVEKMAASTSSADAEEIRSTGEEK